MFLKVAFVPVVWYCGVLKKVVRVDKESIFLEQFGWICECGNTLYKKNRKDHIIVRKEKRNVYCKEDSDDLDVIRMSVKGDGLFHCVVCHGRFSKYKGRFLLRDFICYGCYPRYVKYDVSYFKER